jgi:hypothetical protein
MRVVALGQNHKPIILFFMRPDIFDLILSYDYDIVDERIHLIANIAQIEKLWFDEGI